MRGIYTAAFLDRLVAQEAKVAGGRAMDLGLGFDLICGGGQLSGDYTVSCDTKITVCLTVH